MLVLNYSAVGFQVSSSPISQVASEMNNFHLMVFNTCRMQVLSMHETLVAYGSVYYIGTVIPITLILLSKVIKPPRPARSKPRKDE